MSIKSEIREIRNSVQKDLQKTIDELFSEKSSICRQIIRYHFGWDQIRAMQGKMLRPILVFQTCKSINGKWSNCLPKATAIELIHNFSLIHDDIEDNDEFRHGRSTVWRKYGIAQAINTGDAMIGAAFNRLKEQSCINANNSSCQTILSNTLLNLTKGQAYDIDHQKKTMINSSDYWEVVDLKTGSLIAESFRFGAIAALANQETIDALHEFGLIIGRAFQVRDDFLGIWGLVEKTGKPIISDIVNHKKTYPIILASELDFRIRHLIDMKRIQNKELEQLLSIMQDLDIKTQTKEKYNELINQAAVKLEKIDASFSEIETIKQTISIFFNFNI